MIENPWNWLGDANKSSNCEQDVIALPLILISSVSAAVSLLHQPTGVNVLAWGKTDKTHTHTSTYVQTAHSHVSQMDWTIKNSLR